MAPEPDPLLDRRFLEVRARTTALAAPLTVEDQVVQSMPDASPTKWHLAHSTWFFETFVLQPFAPGYVPFDPAYAYLFNSYYEALGERQPRPLRGALTRPSVPEVGAYRRAVDGAVAGLLGSAAPPAEVVARVVLGLHHEQQHQELLLTDALHALHANPLGPSYGAPPPEPTEPPPPAPWIEFGEGLQEIGHAGPDFAFDNEGPRHRVFLEAFALAARLVTVSEYREFMADGGYRRPSLWLSEGWAAVQDRQWRAPLYWQEREGEWWAFGLSGWHPVSAAEPVSHLSYFEADAFARWAGARLPTEFEWEHAVSRSPSAPANLADANRLRPQAAPPGSGLAQAIGDVWEWTASAYLPYPRFAAANGALGEYNGKFMCNQMVLRGGSCLTPASHIRATYRNFFPPTARWQMSGLRLARWA